MYNNEGNVAGATYGLDLNTCGYATAGIGGVPKAGWWRTKDQDP
jgi:hypothetical protein